MENRRARPSALHRYAQQIRDWMNHPRYARKLRAQLGRWNQLCASLDSLEQTELAMEAYARSASEIGTGEHYLALYGLLQAMVLQQDAVCHLDEALGGNGTGVGDDYHLQSIRKIRNVSVGHPTKVDRRDVMSHHQISRPKIGKGFELVSAFDDGRRQYTFVSVAQLIRRQKLAIARMLRKIAASLDNQQAAKHVVLKTKAEIVRSHAEKRAARARGHRATAKHFAKHASENVAARAPKIEVPPLAHKPRQKKRGDRRRRDVALPRHMERRKPLLAAAARNAEPRRGVPQQTAPAHRRPHLAKKQRGPEIPIIPVPPQQWRKPPLSA